MPNTSPGSSLPKAGTARNKRRKNPEILALARHLETERKQYRDRRENGIQLQADGSVSDSVIDPSASAPEAQQPPQQRHQSVVVPRHNNNDTGKRSASKQRTVSVGGKQSPATPLKEQAYAGPTFQASPAPSSLPVPKFFSKSVPNVDHTQSLSARMAGEKTPEKDASSPESDNVSPSLARASTQSPLDMFFKADKAEKEKSRSGSLLSPDMPFRRPMPATESRATSQQPGHNIFLQELDGASVSRPNAATLTSKQPHAPTYAASNGMSNIEEGESERAAQTQSLKDLLFYRNAQQPQSAIPPNGQHRPHSNPRSPYSPHETPSPFQRPNSGPSTPTPFAQQQHNNYSLHYGNRNLSPLFKASRTDTPPRPSGLRQQEVPSDYTPSRSDPSIWLPPAPQQLPQIDPNSFSRAPMSQQSEPRRPAPSHTLYSPAVVPSSRSSSHLPYHSAPQHGVHSVPNLGATPRTNNGSNDVTTMEDDLRRMLNLNVLSN